MNTDFPTLAIYWGDTRQPLTAQERSELFDLLATVSLYTTEVLVRVRQGRHAGRAVVVRRLGDPGVPRR